MAPSELDCISDKTTKLAYEKCYHCNIDMSFVKNKSISLSLLISLNTIKYKCEKLNIKENKAAQRHVL